MGRPARLGVVLAANLVLVAGLVAVGISAGSVAVLAEGVDYLADAAAIGVTLLALRVSAHRAGGRGQSRYPRAAVLAALVNGGWLLLLSLLVVAEAVLRLSSRVPEVHGLPAACTGWTRPPPWRSRRWSPTTRAGCCSMSSRDCAPAFPRQDPPTRRNPRVTTLYGEAVLTSSS